MRDTNIEASSGHKIYNPFKFVKTNIIGTNIVVISNAVKNIIKKYNVILKNLLIQR